MLAAAKFHLTITRVENLSRTVLSETSVFDLWKKRDIKISDKVSLGVFHDRPEQDKLEQVYVAVTRVWNVKSRFFNTTHKIIICNVM